VTCLLQQILYFGCNKAGELPVIPIKQEEPVTTAEYNSTVDQYSDNVYRFILKHVRDKDKARDIVQDTWEKMWVKVEEISAEKARSYLFTAAYRTMIDLIRRDAKQGKFEESKVAKKFTTDNNYTDLQEILHRALEKLPEVQKSVVLLRDYEGYSYEEIGEITGLSEAQVKVYIFRARQFLKEELGSMEAVL
jgi:RNA polymerase sigma-70 factor (ECF subfamily)